MNEDQERKIMYGLLLLLILAVIATFVVFYKPPETYTALYFTHPLNLTKEVNVNEPFYVDFTIENHEKKGIDYEYVLSFVYYSDQTMIKETEMKRGRVALDDNEKNVISEKVVAKEPYNRVKVSVKLYRIGVDETYRIIYDWKTILK